MKSKRITVVLDDEVVKKLRIIQSKKISKSIEHVSFSEVVNDELRKSLNRRNSSWLNYHFVLDVKKLELQILHWSVLIVMKIFNDAAHDN